MRTGEFLILENLFKENIDYKTVINEEIRIQIEELIKSDKQNKGIYEFKSIGISKNFIYKMII